MIRRQVPAVRPPLAAFALIACLSVPFGRLDTEKARRATRTLPKVELALSGPTTVRAVESLATQRYKVLLTNRSQEPLVLFARNDFLLNAQWSWIVTDAKGRPIGMEFFPTYHGFCGTPGYSEEAVAAWHRLHDSDVVVLNPGESYGFAIPVGPSDDYNFPNAGTYRLSVTLRYMPPSATEYIDAQGQRVKTPHRQGFFVPGGYDQWDLSELSPDVFRLLQDSLSFQSTSSAWDLVLRSKRQPQR
jgi:hypothetical protein